MSDGRDICEGMPYARDDDERAYQRRWYHANKNKRAATRKRNGLRIEAWFESVKESLSCERCGESHPACLAFHHRDRKTKLIEVSRAVARRWSIPRIEKEIAKCDVLCINCHLDAHADERRSLPKRLLPSRLKGRSPYAVDP